MFFRRKDKSRKAKLVDAVKMGFGTKAHRAGWSIIRMPVDVLKQRRQTGEDPDELKQLTFDELLARWKIPHDKIPRLKRTLAAEMLAYAVIFGLGVSSVVYKFANSNDGYWGLVFGVLIGLVGFLQFLLRHHWYLILAKRRYRTFREYLFGERR